MKGPVMNEFMTNRAAAMGIGHGGCEWGFEMKSGRPIKR
jgi:hypothetical protein